MGSSPLPRTSSKRNVRKPRRALFERRVIRYCIFLTIPGFLASSLILWYLPWTTESKLLLLGAEILVCLLIGSALHDHIIRPLQTLANVVGALREEDYSFRARLAVPNDALGELSIEVNALADLLAQHRTGVIEATALLQRVVEEVDLPIFAFDPASKLRLVNSAAEKLLQHPSSELLGKAASDLGLQSTLSCQNETPITLRFSSEARWLVRRSLFRQNGLPHKLVVLSDVSRALREEERRAWQRLIRVIGHELNNSLAPIKSIAGSLAARISEMNVHADERQDFERGLSIIETRAASLNRFLQAYRQLAQMPPPVLRECSIAELVRHVATLETRVAVTVLAGPDLTLTADPDQVEQMLINLLRNAAEAALQPGASEGNGAAHPGNGFDPKVTLTWKLAEENAVLTIEDNGPGLMNPANVFVPFYTTKPQGSGIGLVLSRQICEAHGGNLELANRSEGAGCIVRITIPIVH
jgi:two-component system, NtrC family, nitrogen regulation sensor histidine kinase NtrY